jgi:hypothetical protein
MKWRFGGILSGFVLYCVVYCLLFGQEEITRMREELKKENKEVTAKIKTIKATMNALKIELYSTFGDSINLECE